MTIETTCNAMGEESGHEGEETGCSQLFFLREALKDLNEKEVNKHGARTSKQ